MRIDSYLYSKKLLGVSGLLFASGSFGVIEGDVDYTCSEEKGKTIYRYRGEGVVLQATFELDGDVCIRRDSLTNTSDGEIEIHDLVSRFYLDGNAYEVYTQYNGWQHESEGVWQRLITQLGVAAEGIRTCDGATPMMGFHNLYTEKNVVFHLIPNAQWQMTAKKFAKSNKELVVLETGFYDKALRLRVAPGETVELPAVVFFEAKRKTDLDAYKLHEWYNRSYPRRTLPILYNSWLYCFDNLNVDDLMRQIDCAADMGIEAFMIDAGWFGNGEDWSRCVGDWEENLLSGPRGRLSEISERIRERGMIFGLWFEPERAAPTSRAVAEHPDYYINQKLLDFGNPAAVDYIVDVISAKIEQYHIGWVKFDFNDTIPLDPSGAGFYRYLQGQRDFVLRLRERYPDLYLSNCASGGYRMELGQGMLFDSFWLSDNQGPCEGIRIVKDTLKRMPTALIERWNVQKYCRDLPVTYSNRKTGAAGGMLHTNNGTWSYLVGIRDSFSEAFVQGGPMCFSCDLDGFSDEYKERWRCVIAQYKQDRDFYRTATARILVDSESVIAIEYADPAFRTCRIQVFTKTVYANELILYPTVDERATYSCQDTERTGAEIAENGLLVYPLADNSCTVLELGSK